MEKEGYPDAPRETAAVGVPETPFGSLGSFRGHLTKCNRNPHHLVALDVT